MPELPEVETLRRNLAKSLVWRRFAGIEIRLSKMFVEQAALTAEDLIGKQVLDVRRRAKFLLLDLSGDLSLVFHLRMSGQLVQRAADGQTMASGGHPVPAFSVVLPHRATHVIFTVDDGSALYLTDIRQFGRVWLMPAAMLEGFLAAYSLGPEPLSDDFDQGELRARLRRRVRAQLKPLLLDQTFIGGVGNIYADEIAFEARLSPAVVIGRLKRGQPACLYRAIRSVLQHAVTNGVAEILNGRANPERDFPRVHGRAGQPCPVCRTSIVKSRLGGRGTYTCPRCQRYPAS